MSVHIALLRGVNVGGNKKVAMADLCDMVTGLGFTDARSLLNSGNLVFGSTKSDVAAIERLLEREASSRLGLQTEFFIRSATDWQAVIAANPFPEEARRDPGHLVVMCLKDPTTAKRVEALQAAITGPEVVRAAKTHVYITYPAGIGTSRLTNAMIDKALGTRGTGRNWNTVLKLGALAAARPAS